MNQNVNCLGLKSFNSNVIVWTERQTHIFGQVLYSDHENVGKKREDEGDD